MGHDEEGPRESGIPRRTLIKRGAIVGGLVWATPVVQSLRTPAHAQEAPGSELCAACLAATFDPPGAPPPFTQHITFLRYDGVLRLHRSKWRRSRSRRRLCDRCHPVLHHRRRCDTRCLPVASRRARSLKESESDDRQCRPGPARSLASRSGSHPPGLQWRGRGLGRDK